MQSVGSWRGVLGIRGQAFNLDQQQVVAARGLDGTFAEAEQRVLGLGQRVEREAPGLEAAASLRHRLLGRGQHGVAQRLAFSAGVPQLLDLLEQDLMALQSIGLPARLQGGQFGVGFGQ